MRRLVCVIEGHGEREAVPVLCNRVIRTLLRDVSDWYIDEEPVRQPRSKLVDECIPSPNRGPNTDGLNRALAMAAAREPDSILVICDADDDCPRAWGPAVPSALPRGNRTVAVRGVMASREFESWILWNFPKLDRKRVKAIHPDKSPRDAKKALGQLVPGYSPTTHQLDQTRGLDLGSVWASSDSFDKLVRMLAELTSAPFPVRPKRRSA